MAVVHDYKCSVHGFFESHEPFCPHGCDGEVQMVFLQPVGVKSDRTKGADRTLQNLANDFKMTDIKSAREGDHQNHALLQNKQQNNDFAVKWGNPKDIAGFNLRPVRDEPVQGLASMRNSGVSLPPVRPSVVIRDHENLKVQTV